MFVFWSHCKSLATFTHLLLWVCCLWDGFGMTRPFETHTRLCVCGLLASNGSFLFFPTSGWSTCSWLRRESWFVVYNRSLPSNTQKHQPAHMRSKQGIPFCLKSDCLMCLTVLPLVSITVIIESILTYLVSEKHRWENRPVLHLMPAIK